MNRRGGSAHQSRRGHEREAPTRAQRWRQIKATVLIVGEGRETEPNYFRGLIQEDAVRSLFAVTVKKGPGLSPESVVEEALRQKARGENRSEEYDHVWCVLDVEGQEKRESLDRAVGIARKNGVKVCLSNPAFEVWFLSHFIRSSRAYLDGDEVIRTLSKHWKRHCGQTYAKNDKRVYSRIAHLTGTAIDNAKSVLEVDHRNARSPADANSSTEVYKLVGHLRSSEKPKD